MAPVADAAPEPAPAMYWSPGAPLWSLAASAAQAMDTASGRAAIIKPLTTLFIELPSKKKPTGWGKKPELRGG